MKNFVLQLLISALLLATMVRGEELLYEWRVALDDTVRPVASDQPVITINGQFPGPLINATTNDNIHVNVFNDMDEPVLFTWNGIQQRLNSWEDGLSGTNCAIPPGKNWTFDFQVKDQIGTFSYFPSLNFQKAGGGFGPIRVNNRMVIKVPFPPPEAQFELLVGDWYGNSYKEVRSQVENGSVDHHDGPDAILMNGKGPYLGPNTTTVESFTVAPGKNYMFRISNVGTEWSFNFRIQNHNMVVVETEGSYTNQIAVDSLDVHVGQSYSVLVTSDQIASDYYIVASPKMVDANESSGHIGVGILHYENSTVNATGPLPKGPNSFDMEFSLNQAKSIRWNMTTGAARPNPQGSFNVSNVTLTQTFILSISKAEIDGAPRFTINDVSYITLDTPLKLADHFANGTGFYQLDQFSTNSSNGKPQRGVFVSTGVHKGWLELVLQNGHDAIDSWHLDGFSFFVVGFGNGDWTPESRNSYNLYDPVVRSTTQVYPGGWTAVYAYLDNPGMWNIRSQILRKWYLGQEMYLRVFDADPNPARERPPPANLLLCGNFSNIAPPPPPSSPLEPPPPAHIPPPPALTPPPSNSDSPLILISWYNVMIVLVSFCAMYCH